MPPRRQLTNEAGASDTRRNESNAVAAAASQQMGDKKSNATNVYSSSRPELERATSTTGLEGKVVGLEDDKITGWAWDSTRPYDPVDVELFAGSVLVGRDKADKFDLELAKAKIGNGMHRFEIRLDRLPAGSPPFVLRAVISGTEAELQPSITLATLGDAEQLVSGAEYTGRVTGIADGMLRGWVLNPRNPHEAPMLTLRDGGRTLLTHAAGERISATIDTGVLANVYRFEFPLPVSLLDGEQHYLSVFADRSRKELEGSPILFGPSDAASLGKSLVSVFEKLQRLDRKVDALQPLTDLAVVEKQMTLRILDRIDMLLNIHRDSIERELAVIRRQLSGFMQRIPEMQPDAIAPIATIAMIEDEPKPQVSTFTVSERSTPLLTYDLSMPSVTARTSGELRWSEPNRKAGLRIAGSGEIDLDGIMSAPISLVLNGDGVEDPFQFCGMVVMFEGRPLVGRVDVFSPNAWVFTGTTIAGMVPGLTPRGLAIRYFSEPRRPNGMTLQAVAVYAPGRAPERIDSSLPKASVVHLGNDRMGSGWHSAEASGRGGICWMGAGSETGFRLKRSRSYRFSIPEVRPLTPDIMTGLEISLAGVPASLDVAPLPGDPSAFMVKGRCSMPEDVGEDLILRISFPKDIVRSPMELGLNEDRRPLTIAAHAIAVRGDD